MALDLGTLTGYLALDGSAFDSTIDKMPDKVKGSGVAMGIAGGIVAAGVGAALSNGIQNAIELDSARGKITAQLGLTESESARIGNVAGTLYAQAYGESVEEVNTAVGNVVTSIEGMRGATEESLEAMTAKALNFGQAFEIDTARSTQVVGQLIKSGLVADANEGFDLLTAAMQKVPAAVREDVMDAADEYGPFFASLGMEGEEAFSLLAKGAETGMYGIDKTGDALKEFSIRATDMSTASKAGFDAVGLSQEEMANKILAGGDSAKGAFDQIVQGLLDIEDPAARSNAAIALFGTPLEDLGVTEIPNFLASLQGVEGGLGDVAGAADQMGKDLNDNAGTSWEQLSRTWDSIIGQLGTALLPILKELADWANENPVVLQILAAAVGVLAVAFLAVTAATWAMNTALLANPITWIVLAIVALIAALVLLVANWDTVAAWIEEVWGGFIGWITGVMDGFITWWNDLWTGVWEWLVGIWESIVQFGAEAILNFYVGLMVVGAQISAWWTGLWDSVFAFLGEAWANGMALIDGALAFILDLFLNWTLVGLLIQYWDEIWGGIESMWGNVTGFFSALPGRILAFLVTFGTLLYARGRALLDGLMNGLKAVWVAISSWFGGIPGAVVGWFSDAGSWLYSAGRNIVDGLMSGLSSMASTVGSFFLGLLPDWIVGPFKAALGIASPSKVFAGFGRNIAEGVIVGLDDQQGALDARMRELVPEPEVSSLYGAQGDAGDGTGTEGSAGRGSIHREVNFYGNVGMSPEELVDEMDRAERNAMALEGVDEITVVG